MVAVTAGSDRGILPPLFIWTLQAPQLLPPHYPQFQLRNQLRHSQCPAQCSNVPPFMYILCIPCIYLEL
ncbi:hypothetical protein XENORESO_017992 [Xenotaenia resolanae]|uniref:Uncharacterized protein n=1 Tax=Xenotaenia resolanae TaxID=208358 RepID=A0ABV0WB39_9TELE